MLVLMHTGWWDHIIIRARAYRDMVIGYRLLKGVQMGWFRPLRYPVVQMCRHYYTYSTYYTCTDVNPTNCASRIRGPGSMVHLQSWIHLNQHIAPLGSGRIHGPSVGPQNGSILGPQIQPTSARTGNTWISEDTMCHRTSMSICKDQNTSIRGYLDPPLERVFNKMDILANHCTRARVVGV